MNQMDPCFLFEIKDVILTGLSLIMLVGENIGGAQKINRKGDWCAYEHKGALEGGL